MNAHFYHHERSNLSVTIGANSDVFPTYWNATEVLELQVAQVLRHLIRLHVVEYQRHLPLLHGGGWGLVDIHIWAPRKTKTDRSNHTKSFEGCWRCCRVMELRLGIRSKAGSQAGGVGEGWVRLLSLWSDKSPQVLYGLLKEGVCLKYCWELADPLPCHRAGQESMFTSHKQSSRTSFLSQHVLTHLIMWRIWVCLKSLLSEGQSL